MRPGQRQPEVRITPRCRFEFLSLGGGFSNQFIGARVAFGCWFDFSSLGGGFSNQTGGLG